MKTLVYIEIENGSIQNGSLEIMSLAKTLSDPCAVVIGSDADNASDAVSAYGIPVIEVPCDKVSDDAEVFILNQIIKDEKPEYVLFAGTLKGKDLAPRVAARNDGACITDVIKADIENGVFTRPAFGGTVLENLKFSADTLKVMTVRSGSFEKLTQGEKAEVTKKEYALPEDALKVILKDSVKEISEKVDLEGADVVIAGGRGMGSKEGFAMVEELASLLGGEVGATRAAVDEEWTTRIHQVGQSGKNIAPKLYIACGLSGAMQHVSGITSSGFIVAINKDEDAPIFDVADLGIVGRCEDILPVLIDEIKKLKGL